MYGVLLAVFAVSDEGIEDVSVDVK